MTKEEWVALFQAMNGRDPLPQEFLAAKKAGDFTSEPVNLPEQEVVTEGATSPVEESSVEVTAEPIAENQTLSAEILEEVSQEGTPQVESFQEGMDKVPAEDTSVDMPETSAPVVPDVQPNFEQYHQEQSNTWNQGFQQQTYNQNTNTGYQQGVSASYFDGGVLEYWLYQIGGSILISITLLIATPWVLCMIERWRVRHIVIDGRRLRFDGTGGQLFGNWIKWLLLIIITLGIYSFWVAVKLEQWKAKHTHFE